MYNPLDNLCPGGDDAGVSRGQYQPSARLLLKHGVLVDHESTRAAMRSCANWIHPSDLVDAQQYWFSRGPVPSEFAAPSGSKATGGGAFTTWVDSMDPSPWVAHVGAIGRSALDRNVRDPAAAAAAAAFRSDTVDVTDKYRAPVSSRTPLA